MGGPLIINHRDHKDEEKRECAHIDYGILRVNQRIIKKCMFWRTEKLYNHSFRCGLNLCENICKPIFSFLSN